MYNDFILVGPPADPAGIAGMKDAPAALARIAAAGAPFISRGDDSGTHIREQSLWKAAGVDVKAASGTWYRETGSGMGATLNVGVGMGAYVMTDRATWIAFRNKGDFRIAVQGDKALFNQYGIMQVSPQRCPNVKADAAGRFMSLQGSVLSSLPVLASVDSPAEDDPYKGSNRERLRWDFGELALAPGATATFASVNSCFEKARLPTLLNVLLELKSARTIATQRRRLSATWQPVSSRPRNLIVMVNSEKQHR